MLDDQVSVRAQDHRKWLVPGTLFRARSSPRLLNCEDDYLNVVDSESGQTRRPFPTVASYGVTISPDARWVAFGQSGLQYGD